VLVARIAKSWAAPHRVTLGGDNNFYGRHSSGKYQMDVDQLRSAFTLSTNVTERIKEIHRHLISDALAQQDDLCPPPWICLHMIPYESIDPSRMFDLATANDANQNLNPLGQTGFHDRRFNFDGIRAYKLLTRANERPRTLAYTQVFRNGIVESIDAGTSSQMLSDADRQIAALHIEVEILKAFRRFLRIQQTVGVSPPIVVLLSLLGIREYFLNTGHLRQYPAYTHCCFDREHLLIPGGIVDSFESDRAAVLKPVLVARCLDYKETGELSIDHSWFQNEP